MEDAVGQQVGEGHVEDPVDLGRMGGEMRPARERRHHRRHRRVGNGGRPGGELSDHRDGGRIEADLLECLAQGGGDGVLAILEPSTGEGDLAAV